MRRIKFPSPATVLASVALLVSLSGTAVAAGVVPLAKRALFADNAGKLQGQTAAQIAATAGPADTLNGKTADEIAATPGPATTLEGKSLADIVASLGGTSTGAALVSSSTGSFSLAADSEGNRSVSCPTGAKVVSGGWTSNDDVEGLDSWPSSDTAWTIYLVNLSSNQAASGTLYAVCLK